MKALYFLLAIYSATTIWAFDYSGCYASVGVSLSFRNSYPLNVVDQCSSICGNSKYMGIIDGTKCFCGDTKPLSVPVSDTNCNANCTGSSNPTCGGTGFYAFFSNAELLSSSSSSSTTSTMSSSTSSSSSLSTTSSSSSTITVSPSSTSAFAAATLYNSSYSSTTLASNTSSSLLHSHRSASTSSLSSGETVITSNSKYVSNGVTITSAVLLTTKNADVELTETAGNTVSSSVTVVNSRSASIKSQVAGGVVGASAGISLICFLVWYYTRRVKQKDEEEKQRDLAIIAATMASKNQELSHSNTVYSTNPFSPRTGSLGSKPSTKRRLGAEGEIDNPFAAQVMRMGSTGRESTFHPVRMGSTGHDEEHHSAGESTLNSFSSVSTDGYYAEKMAAMNMNTTSLTRNTSSATASTGHYSFASFESNGIIVDDEIASNMDRDDGSLHEYVGAGMMGLTIANPDNDSDSDDDEAGARNNNNNSDGQSKLRVLF